MVSKSSVAGDFCECYLYSVHNDAAYQTKPNYIQSLLWIILLLVSFAVFAGFVDQLRDPFWLNSDEGTIVWISLNPIKQLFEVYKNQTHPALSYVVFHGIASLGGGVLALRLFSFSCSILAVVFCFFAFRADRKIYCALATLPLVTASGFQIYSFAIRPYAVVLMLLFAHYCALRSYYEKDHLAYLILSSIALFIGCFFHYGIFLYAVPYCVFTTIVAATVLNKKHLICSLVIDMILGACGIWMYLTRISGFSHVEWIVELKKSWLTYHFVKSFSAIPDFLVGTFEFVFGYPVLLSIFFVAIGPVALFAVWLDKPKRFLVMYSMMVIVFGLLLSSMKMYPLGYIRHSILFLPAFVVISGNFILVVVQSVSVSRFMRIASLVGLCFVVLYLSSQRFTPGRFRTPTAELWLRRSQIQELLKVLSQEKFDQVVLASADNEKLKILKTKFGENSGIANMQPELLSFKGWHMNYRQMTRGIKGRISKGKRAALYYRCTKPSKLSKSGPLLYMPRYSNSNFGWCLKDVD